MQSYTDLIKALRHCTDNEPSNGDCWNCPYQGEKCHTLLSDAAAAIEALQAEQKKTVTQIFGEEQMAWEGRCKDLMKYISDLQAEIRESMQKCAECGENEPKRGEWELIDGAEPMRWGCSRCKYMSWETSTYCPRCGAKMEVQDGK